LALTAFRLGGHALLRTAAIALVCCVLAAPVVAQDKRVLALEFLDHSGFDSPHGCGCLVFGPLAGLFGRSRGQREYWELDVGFRDMLVSTLGDAYGYEAIAPEEADAAMRELDISARDLRRSGDARRLLAERLNATALVEGVIRSFKQERARGMYRKDVSGQTGAGSGSIAATVEASAAVGVVGAYYVAGVEVDFTVHGRTGTEIMAKRVSRGQRFTTASVKSGPLEAGVSDAGPSARIGPQPLLPRVQGAPVVNPEALNQIAFGREGWDTPATPGRAPNFRRTLLGRVTQDVMAELVREVRERVGPPLPDDSADEPPVVLVGKVAFIERETGDVYINLGTRHGIAPGDVFRVLREGEAITDPDTGERLGATETPVGAIEVIEVARDKLSRTRVTDGVAEEGDVVRLLPAPTDDPAPDSPDSGGQSR
jgi:hypothetical protein